MIKKFLRTRTTDMQYIFFIVIFTAISAAYPILAVLQRYLSRVAPYPGLRPRIRRDPRDLLSVMRPSIGYPAGIAVIFIFSFEKSYSIDSKYPVDISFMVSDLKYSQEHGIKICEVQHGAISTFNGDLSVHGEMGTISPRFSQFFNQFSQNKWIPGYYFSPLYQTLIAAGWIPKGEIPLGANPLFLFCANTYPDNPQSINSYSGILYSSRDLINGYQKIKEIYPGILFVDAATLPYWHDKYKMSLLFTRTPELKQIKPEWNLYKKGDPVPLAKQIKEDIRADCYVIKPRSESLGHGVIIVDANDLETTLEMIMNPKISLKKHDDPSFRYWFKNKESSFIVEKYYPSDLIEVALDPNKENVKSYNGTMRVAFILMYNEGSMSCQCLGAYWRLPEKGVGQGGTLNQERKDLGSKNFFSAVSQELLSEIYPAMEEKMTMLYQQMLEIDDPVSFFKIEPSIDAEGKL